jgi:hypothetical protein
VNEWQEEKEEEIGGVEMGWRSEMDSRGVASCCCCCHPTCLLVSESEGVRCLLHANG